MNKNIELEIVNSFRQCHNMEKMTMHEMNDMDKEQEKLIKAFETAEKKRIPVEKKEKYEYWMIVSDVYDTKTTNTDILFYEDFSEIKQMSAISQLKEESTTWFYGGKHEIPAEEFEWDERFAGMGLPEYLRESEWYPLPFGILKNPLTYSSDIPQRKIPQGD